MKNGEEKWAGEKEKICGARDINRKNINISSLCLAACRSYLDFLCWIENGSLLCEKEKKQKKVQEEKHELEKKGEE